YCPKLRSTRHVFLNDCKIEACCLLESRIDFVDDASPITAFGLSLVYAKKVGGWATLQEQSVPCIEDRLRFVEKVSHAREMLQPHQRGELRIRPNMELAKVIA
ncbi:MAG: hypothetical protein Q8M16_15075, partial [Pirellulaceae bacterium]|nr:hypothetical protein [Pirellulaceae bacterium]